MTARDREAGADPAATPARAARDGSAPPTDDALVGLARAAVAACIARRLTLATAESCTGGLVGHALTEVAGSSAAYRGGVVAYANDVKSALLGVDVTLLARHGAVSAEVAAAMARGARERLGADLAVAVTGVAGPDGGTAEKPVGLVYVAIAGPGLERVHRCVWSYDRSGNKRASAAVALTMIRDAALG